MSWNSDGAFGVLNDASVDGGPAAVGKTPNQGTRLSRLAAAARGVTERANRVLARLDPNDDPNADPLTAAPVLVLLVATLISAGLFFRWKIQPMQDWGHHLAMIAVVADYKNPASIYPALYHPIDVLNTNALLYVVAGYLGRLIGASWAARITLGTYLVTMPIATLYALRVFGRSGWCAVLAIPLCYNMSYVSGFANFTFATPFLILIVPLFYRMLRRPARRLVVINVVLFALLFLAHVHVYLWAGFLCFLMALAACAAGGIRALRRQAAWWTPLLTGGISLLVVLPSLLLFYRWYRRAVAGPAPDELSAGFAATAPTWKAFVAQLKSFDQLFADLAPYLHIVNGDLDLIFYVFLGVGAIVALLLHVGPPRKHPPVLECVCALTLLSYFFLPEDFAGQGVLGSRQLGLGLHFAPALFSPTWADRRRNRAMVVAMILGLTSFHLWFWTKALIRFEREEALPLQWVLSAAPPRLTLTYVNPQPRSKNIYRFVFWHVDKWYMADKYGQCPDNPALGTMNAIRYRNVAIARVPQHHMEWFADRVVLDNFDLVLTRLWVPTPQQLAVAEQRATLLRARGDYQLWRIRH